MPQNHDQQLLLSIEVTLLGILAAVLGGTVIAILLGFVGLTLVLAMLLLPPRA